jgi:hypothetical protein
MKHCDLLDNHIVVVERARNRRLWRFFLYFLFVCILAISILLGLAKSSSHDNFPITKTVVDYLVDYVPAGMMPKFDANLTTENQKRKGPWRRQKKSPHNVYQSYSSTTGKLFCGIYSFVLDKTRR